MPDSDAELERRLAAVERSLDANGDSDGPSDGAHSDTDEFEARLAELESRVDELDAAVQAVRGFLGGVSAVNESVERRADAAVAAVERIERRLDDDPPDSVDASGDGGSTPFSVDEDTTTTGEGTTVPDDAEEDGLRERLRSLR